MPIIVNELEVVVAPPPESAPRNDPTLPPPPRAEPAPPGALELAALLERRTRQALRVFAH